MITAIEFKSPDFEPTDSNNLINPATDNLIIICDSRITMRTIAHQFSIANAADGPSYTAANNFDAEIERILDYNKTIKYTVDNEQLITITTETPFALSATDPWDIWFAAENRNHRIEIYPFCAFKGHKDDWARGLQYVHRQIILGRYGDFI